MKNLKDDNLNGEKAMNIEKLPFVNLIRKPGRTIALVLLAAVLGFSVFGGSMIVLSLQNGLKSLELRLGADIIVVPSSAQSKVSFQNMLLQGTTGAFYMSRDNLDRILEVEGVEQAAPQVFLASLKADCCSIKLQVIGIDQDTDFIVQPWIEESCKKKLEEYDIVVGTNISAQVGEILRIYDERCHVAGRLAPTGTGLDSAVYCNMETMKKLLKAAENKGISHKIESGSEVISAVYVKVRDGYDIGKVNSAIQGHTRNATAVRTKSMITDVSGSLSGIAKMITWLIAAIWLLSLVILITAFAMIANERKKEFALLRLMGTSRRLLGRLVRKESILCSLAGGILGIGVAGIVLSAFAALIESRLGLPYLTPTAAASLFTGAATLVAVLLAGALSCTWAAMRLAKADPGVVLRNN